MRLIDDKGRIAGRVSVLDLLIALLVAGLALGFVYKRASANVQQMVNADTPFYVTLVSTRLRDFAVAAVAEGDVMYLQYDRQPMGRVVKLETEPATDYMLKTDGTALLAPMDDRYTLYITLACTGSITDAGYYLNGAVHLAEGSQVVLVSNRVYLSLTQVYALSETP